MIIKKLDDISYSVDGVIFKLEKLLILIGLNCPKTSRQSCITCKLFYTKYKEFQPIPYHTGCASILLHLYNRQEFFTKLLGNTD